MLFYNLFTLIFIIAIASGGKLTDLPKSEHNTNHTIETNTTTHAPKVEPAKVTKLAMVSEGGPIETQSPLPTLLSNNSVQTLLNLDKELGKSKESPSVPRKSAPTEVPATAAHVTNSTDINNGTTVKNTSKNDTKISPTPPSQTKVDTTDKLSKVNPGINANKTVTGSVKNVTTKAPIMKPTLTSYEQLVSSPNNATQLRIIFNDKGTTTTTLMSPTTKVISNMERNTTSHPGMVIPLVITVLVVPVFAVLGFMALKRGQEAWKNRHYKRMDFLLDGMYND